MEPLAGRIGFVGGGMMAEALCRGLLAAGVCDAGQVLISEPEPPRRAQMAAIVGEANVFDDNVRVCAEADTVVLAVKPQVAPDVLKALHGKVSSRTLVVSIVTGLTLHDLAAGLGTKRVIRVMPNTPALVGEGASAYSVGEGASDADRETARLVLSAVGLALELPEKHLAAVTGLSGSGPAFIYVLIEAMADAGVYLGLPRTVALDLAAQTVKGAAEMVRRTGDHPGLLKDKVTTPGGTTIEGLLALEQAGLRTAIMNAVVAAGQKAILLSKKTE